MRQGLILLFVVVALLGAIVWTGTQKAGPDPLTGLNTPAMTATAQTGEALFGQYCRSCHGDQAAGTDQGPPLVHKIYEPSHHPDAAFYLAAQNGVRAHHWRYGDMPPVEGITEVEIAPIIDYVRAIQRANGID
ncbi:c-type cytochrome [Cucumibacter marinus]|uniref:c-type cytochrome n=1 Tax=Cucumibacter marinus TaxID=1121252 RepID=UPI0003FCB9FF|nr:cytochrome c [Cucumibacter marinus]